MTPVFRLLGSFSFRSQTNHDVGVDCTNMTWCASMWSHDDPRESHKYIISRWPTIEHHGANIAVKLLNEAFSKKLAYLSPSLHQLDSIHLGIYLVSILSRNSLDIQNNWLTDWQTDRQTTVTLAAHAHRGLINMLGTEEVQQEVRPPLCDCIPFMFELCTGLLLELCTRALRTKSKLIFTYACTSEGHCIVCN